MGQKSREKRQKPFVAHVVKTFGVIDRKTETVHVGIRCDVCGEIQLPPIPFDHIAAFERLLHDLHHQLQSPDFRYYPATKNGPGIVDKPEDLDPAIDWSNVISEVLKMSKAKKGAG